MKSLLRIIICLSIIATQSIWVELSANAKSSKQRYNRITVGSVEIKDWHKDVVKKYPNLNHYHWNPIYANVQGMKKVKPPRHTTKGAIKASPRRHYKKKARKVSPKYIKYKPIVRRPQHVYKKPKHVSHNVASRLNSSRTHGGYKHIAPQRRTNPSLSHRNTSPRLAHKKTDIAHSHKPNSLKAPQKSYSRSNKGTLARKKTDIQLAHRKVDAKLESKQVKADLARAEQIPQVKTYKPYKSTQNYPYEVIEGSQTKTKVSGTLTY